MASKSFQWLGLVIDNSLSGFFFFFSGPTVGTPQAQEVMNFLNEDSENEANIILSSNGGDMFIAQRIVGLLSPYKSRITVEVVGLAASAGSFLAAALGYKTYVRDASQIQIHAPETFTEGNLRDHQNTIKLFESGHDIMRTIYKDNSKLTNSELDSVFNDFEEIWLTAQESVDKGIADELLEANKQVAEVMERLNSDDIDDDERDLFVAQFPLAKIAAAINVPGGVAGLAAHNKKRNNPSSSTEVTVTEEEKRALQAERDALKAERDALKDQVKNLQESNKTLQDKLDTQAKELSAKAHAAVVDAAVAAKKITAEEKEVWLKRMADAPETVEGILKDMKGAVPHSEETGTGADKATGLADIPADIVAAYRKQKFTDEQIVASWEEDNQ